MAETTRREASWWGPVAGGIAAMVIGTIAVNIVTTYVRNEAALEQQVNDLSKRVDYDEGITNKRFDTDESNISLRLDKIDTNQADERRAVVDQTQAVQTLTDSIRKLPGWQRQR